MPPARPILFSAPMIRALLDGRKTQTRRIIKPQPQKDFEGWDWGWLIPGKNVTPGTAITWRDDHDPSPAFRHWYCPYGRAGDLLWVRESICDPRGLKSRTDVAYRATDKGCYPWIPSIHMPRWASRLTLEITDVRVERLNDISNDDAIAEGIKICPNMNNREGATGYVWPESPYDKAQLCHSSPVTAFNEGWRIINGDPSANENPWLWALTFIVHGRNVGTFPLEQAA